MRHYAIVTETRHEMLGYASPDSQPSQLRRVLRTIEAQFLPHYFAMPPRWRKYVRRLSPNRTLPDFCIVGPPKCATSDLAVTLLLHPNVIPPLAKELPSADPEVWRLYYPTERQKRRHAIRHGMALSPYLHPSLHWMAVPYNLAHINPNERIVIVLRDPIKRLYSHWKWELFLAGKSRAARFPFLATFRSYVEKSLEMHGSGLLYSPSGASGLMHSIYPKAVKNWTDCFGRQNVLVLDIKGYFSQQQRFMERIYEFVGLPPMKLTMLSEKANENPIEAPPADADTIGRLRKFFAPYNEDLWDVIGERFSW